MDTEMILTIVTLVLAGLSVIGGFFSYYFYIKKKLAEKLASEIDDAEDSDKIAEEKRDLVVAQLKALIPMMFRPFITDAVLEGMVQAAFDKIEDYAKKQLEKKANKEDK